MEHNKEKQIEEIAVTEVDILANDLNQHCADLKENYCGYMSCLSCLAHALTEKGYRKASEVAREISRMLREDLRGLVDLDYLERLLMIYEKKYTESEGTE